MRGNTRALAGTALINMGAMNIAVLSASLLSVRLFGPLDRLLYGTDRLHELLSLSA